ncbi:MAG: hypothetical protein ACLFR0_03505 [Alphaproteobacteria bacterium]
MPKPTEIHVSPKTEDVRFVTHKSLAELQKQEIDTINPHSFSGVSVTQGFASGEIRMEANVKLGYQTNTRTQMSCVWYDSIEVNFHIRPDIHIAREVYEDRCMGAAVKEHELKHVRVDKVIVNKYANIIGRKIYDGLKDRGFIAGPIAAANKEAVADRMRQTVSQIIDLEMKRLELDRMDMQMAVDTKEEYERVAAQCPDFKVTPDMLEEEKKAYGLKRYRR